MTGHLAWHLTKGAHGAPCWAGAVPASGAGTLARITVETGGLHGTIPCTLPSPAAASQHWRLSSLLPGQGRLSAEAPGPVTGPGLEHLMGVAEGWLDEFVTGLGATWPRPGS